MHEDHDILGMFSPYEYTWVKTGKGLFQIGCFVAVFLSVCYGVKLTYPDRVSYPREFEGGLERELGGVGGIRASQTLGRCESESLTVQCRLEWRVTRTRKYRRGGNCVYPSSKLTMSISSFRPPLLPCALCLAGYLSPCFPCHWVGETEIKRNYATEFTVHTVAAFQSVLSRAPELFNSLDGAGQGTWSMPDRLPHLTWNVFDVMNLADLGRTRLGNWISERAWATTPLPFPGQVAHRSCFMALLTAWRLPLTTNKHPLGPSKFYNRH